MNTQDLDTANTLRIQHCIRHLMDDQTVTLVHATAKTSGHIDVTTDQHRHGTFWDDYASPQGIAWYPTGYQHTDVCDALFPGWRENNHAH